MISYIDQSSLNWNFLFSETYNRAQSKERPMSYADRRFSYNADSGIFIMENSFMVKKFEYTRMLVFETLWRTISAIWGSLTNNGVQCIIWHFCNES